MKQKKYEYLVIQPGYDLDKLNSLAEKGYRVIDIQKPIDCGIQWGAWVLEKELN